MRALARLFAKKEIEALEAQVRKLVAERDQYKTLAATARRGFENERILRKQAEAKASAKA